jgi:hypothetical protein
LPGANSRRPSVRPVAGSPACPYSLIPVPCLFTSCRSTTPARRSSPAAGGRVRR